ncbi:MAG: HEAT repeat domain-containing protein [Desulfobacteraceae bacterium]|nr:MAG: HEAT repeat domain-containing protein [Desulfobacteraceae bacterium]
MDFGIAALPYFSAAFEHEQDPQRRALLIEIIWEFRDIAVLPALSAALNDPSPLVWKEALNGLVVLDSEDCVKVIEAAKARPFKKEKDSIYFREWLNEAIQQLKEGFYGEKLLKPEADDPMED